jgi:hypothetical protein
MYAIAIAVGCAVASSFCFLTPILVMSPFRTQGQAEFALALRLHRAGPVISALAAILALAVALPAWRASSSREMLGGSVAVALLGAVFTRVNVFELVFRPYRSAGFVAADAIALDREAMVMSFTANGETHAYPVGAMGYHHIMNDEVGGAPVVATYCTVCHTGIVWKREAKNHTLTFRLAGIHDGNALLRDEQTESVWQQTSGEAIHGPLKGERLEMMHSDELSFGLWRAEHPEGRILRPIARFASLYRNQGWEKFIERFPAVMDTSKTGIEARELVFGIATGAASKAFPASAVFSGGLIQDCVGDEPVLLLVGPDKLSVRAFRIPANTTFLRGGEAIVDAETSSAWNFSGCAVRGARTGERLRPLDVVKEYWFDWRHYHPGTAVVRGHGSIK